MTNIPGRLTAALADRYRIERELGRGGMATVYLAHDLRHDRQVAIKVLHEDLGATLGPERFLAEIKTTARLQHPHILALMDSGSTAPAGEGGGLLFYVMPYVEGESLRSRLQREKQLPIEDAVRIAREVADALGYAHGHGIIHRDVKPENILLQGGHALVADFGIALAVQQAGGTRLTQTGLSLGTPSYMSPEQAMGEPTIDARSDIYALGAVTYEMLTGEPPFTGATVQAIVAKVLSSEPERPTTIRRTIPAPVEAAVLKALAKLPADRFAAASQFGDAVGVAGPASAVGQALPVAHPVADDAIARRMRRWSRVAAVVAVWAVGATAAAVWATRRLAESPLPEQYDIVLPDSAPITFGKGSPWGESWTALAVSPRGDYMVYLADRGASTELWYRSLLDSTARPIPGTEGAYMLAMAPDGGSVAFIAGNKLKVSPISGAGARELGDVRRPDGLTWLSRDRLLVSEADGGTYAFDRMGGGTTKLLTSSCPAAYPLSADEVLCGRGVGISAWRLSDSVEAAVTLASADAAGRTRLLGGAAEVLGSGHVIYTASDGTVMGARWNRGDYTVQGRASVHSGVRTESVYWSRQASVAASGTMVFVPGAYNGRGQLVRSDGSGEPVPLPVEPVMAEQFDVDGEGRRLALIVGGVSGIELRVIELSTGRSSRWIAAPTLAEPRWSPDGQRLAVYASSDPDGFDGVMLVGDPRAGRDPDTLRAVSVRPSDWYAEDQLLGYQFARDPSTQRIVRVSLGANVAVDTIPSNDVRQRPVLSPSGRLIAYMSGENIVVEGYPAGDRRTVVARGLDPLWLDDRTVVYRDGSTWYRARANADASLAGQPERWFSDARFIDTNVRSHAMTPSGEIVYLRSIAPPTARHVRVVPHWTRSVQAAVAAAERQ